MLVPLSVIIPSVRVVPFHLGILLLVVAETCGSVSVIANEVELTQEAFPVASDYKTNPEVAPLVI